MLMDRRRNRIASLIIGGMGKPQDSYESKEYGKDDMMDYKKDGMMEHQKKPGHTMLSSYEALEMACGSMMQAIRSDDVKALCRSFKAAYKACEQYEEEMEYKGEMKMEEGSHNSHNPGKHGGY